MDYNNEEEYNDNNLWDETITSYNEEINQIPHNDEKEIPEYIVEKIIKYYIFNNELCDLIKSKYNNNTQFFGEYYAINANWFNNFLEFYNYKKIYKLIKKKCKYNLDKGDLYQKIKEFNLFKKPGDNNIIKNNLKNNFYPEKEIIPREIYIEDISEKTIEFFNNFIIVKKDLYEKIRQDNDNEDGDRNYYFDSKEDIVKICLVDNTFIYRIADNILGFGLITESSLDNKIPLLKLLFLIIIDVGDNDDGNDDDNENENDKYNSDTELQEIFKIKDLNKYLDIHRRVKFNDENNNNNIINIYAENKKIGFLYKIGDFNPEIYYKRNKSKEIENQMRIAQEAEEEMKKKIEKEKEEIRIKENKLRVIIEAINNDKIEIQRQKEENEKNKNEIEKIWEILERERNDFENQKEMFERIKNDFENEKEMFERERNDFENEKEMFERIKNDFENEKEMFERIKNDFENEKEMFERKKNIYYRNIENKNNNQRYSNKESSNIKNNNLLFSSIQEPKNISRNNNNRQAYSISKYFHSRPLTSKNNLPTINNNIQNNNNHLKINGINIQKSNNFKTNEEINFQNNIINSLKKEDNYKGIYSKNNTIYIVNNKGDTFQLNLNAKKINEKKNNNNHKNIKSCNKGYYINIVQYGKGDQNLKNFEQKIENDLNKEKEKNEENIQNYQKLYNNNKQLKLEEKEAQKQNYNNVLKRGQIIDNISMSKKMTKLMLKQQKNQEIKSFINN